MKKAKIALTAIAIVGIVGGALAFHSAKFVGSTYFVPNSQNGNCDQTASLTNYITDDVSAVTTTISPAVTASIENTCTGSTVTLYQTDTE